MGPNCTECPLGQKAGRVVVPPQMPVGRWNGLAIIGEQPARKEAQERTPFVGNSGHLLNSILHRAGIDRSQCFVTNAFHCFHEAATDMKEDEKSRCARACRSRLITELQGMVPQNTLALGGVSLKSITNNWSTSKSDEPGWTATITDLRGGVLRSPIGDLLSPDVPGNAVASFHPASILRSGGQEADILAADIYKVARWIQQGGPKPWQDSYVLCPRAHELEQFLTHLRSTWGGATVDIECVQGIGEEKFNRWMDRIRMIGIGSAELAMVIPMLDGEWQQFYTRDEHLAVIDVLRRFLGDQHFFCVFHNLQYDIPVLHRHQLPVRGMIHDTMAAHYTLYHMGVRHGLGYVAQQYLDVPPWKELHGHEHVDVTFVDEAIYNSRDILTTSMVLDPLLQDIIATGVWETYRMTVRNHELAWQMGRDGVYVHPLAYHYHLFDWAQKRVRDQIELMAQSNAGTAQLELLKRIRTIKIDALQRAKLDSFASGEITLSDVVALRNMLNEAKQCIVQKRGIRELDETEQILTKVLSRPRLDAAISTYYTIGAVYEAVKSKKQGKKDEQPSVTHHEMNALPMGVREAFAAHISETASAKIRGQEAFIDDVQTRARKGEKVKKDEERKLERLLEQRAIANFPLSDPNHLKLVGANEWSAAMKEHKSKASDVASKARTAAGRLIRYSTRYPFVNFNADYETGLVIHGWFNLPVQAPLTSKGEYAVDKEALRHIKGHPLVKAYQGAKLSHDRWDWLRSLPIYPDGRVHPYFKPTLKSGRWASGDSGNEAHPLETLNAQNIEEIMMEIFYAPVGYKYVGADYSGVELRVGGVMTGCTNLIEQFRRYDEGNDLKVHAQTARRIWKQWEHLPLAEQKKYYQEGKRYKLAKSGGFLCFYGGGPGALAQKILEMEPYEPDAQKRVEREAEIQEEAKHFMQELEGVWPEVFSVREQWYLEACRTGILPIGRLTGRYLRFPLVDRDHVSPTLCANAPVQCTAGEISHYGLDKLVRALPANCRVILYIHDCIIVECPECMAEDVKVLMKECMEYWFEGPAGGLMCRVDPKIGDSIADVH